MTNNLLYQELSEHYKNNLERYIKDYPGEYILIEEYCVESFYKNKAELGKAINKKYWESMDYTIFGTRIPKEK